MNGVCDLRRVGTGDWLSYSSCAFHGVTFAPMRTWLDFGDAAAEWCRSDL